MNRRHAFLCCVFAGLASPLLTGPAVAADAGYDPELLVDARAGSMPVILASPHDGTESVPGVDARDDGVMVRDANATLLATRAADFIERKTGRRPYIVAARFSRKYIDANRSEKEAVESPEALPAYRAYHAHLAAFIADVKARWPGGALLIDVHGQGAVADGVFRGTRNGLSVKALTAKHGDDAIAGEDSLLGRLNASGYKTFPAPGAREVRFNGGNTVVQYGSHHSGGIDTIQLEFGKNLRDSTGAAEDFGNAILAFEKAYLAGGK